MTPVPLSRWVGVLHGRDGGNGRRGRGTGLEIIASGQTTLCLVGLDSASSSSSSITIITSVDGRRCAGRGLYLCGWRGAITRVPGCKNHTCTLRQRYRIREKTFSEPPCNFGLYSVEHSAHVHVRDSCSISLAFMCPTPLYSAFHLGGT